MQTATTSTSVAGRSRKAYGEPYIPPAEVRVTTIGELLQGVRQISEQHQPRFGITPEDGCGTKIWVAGDSSLVKLPCVAIVGSRKVFEEGATRARQRNAGFSGGYGIRQQRKDSGAQCT
jgi:hypothetical protein